MNTKTNQKQFQRYNSKLFKAYINKFSDDDKITMLFDMMASVPESVGEKLTLICHSSREERDSEIRFTKEELQDFVDSIDDKYRPYTTKNIQGMEILEEYLKNKI